MRAVTCAGEEAGEMRGSAGDRGLALLRIDRLAAAADQGLRFAAGDAILTPERPAWLTDAPPPG